jgi:hypothetical protein
LGAAIVLGAVAAGGSTYLPATGPGHRSAAPKGLVPGYGGPVSDQSSGALETPSPSSVAPVNELEAAGSRPSRPERVRGSFIVALASGENPDQAAGDIARDYGGEAKLVYDNVIGGFQFVGPDDAGTRLAHDPRVRSVQPDYVATTAESSASTHLAADGATCCASVSATNNGHGVRIGIIDTGADVHHVDISSQIASDSHSCVSTSVSPSYQDENGHGTRTTSNAVGLNGLGVAPGAKAVVVRVFSGTGSSTSFATVMCGVNYIAGLNRDASTTNDVQVVNVSISGSSGAGTCTDGGLRQAVCQLVNGTTGTTTKAAFFAAAGNNGSDASSFAPGNFPEAIAVSGFDCSSINCTTTTAKLWSSSNRGPKVDLGGPAVDIYSSMLGSTNGHELATGTSRASPQAAGAAADLISSDSSLAGNPTAIRADLKKGGKCPGFVTNGTTSDCTTAANWTSDDSYTEPFLNVAGAIAAAGGGSGPPPTDNPPTVSFNSPTNGANVATSFTVSVHAQDDLDTPTAKLSVDSGTAQSMSCGSGTSVTCTLAVGPLSAASHTLTAQSFDAHSHSSTPVTITVTASSSTSTVFYSQNFDSGSATGWTVASSNSTVKWHLANNCAGVNPHASGYAVWYGNNSTCNYATGTTANNGTVTTPVVSGTPHGAYKVTFLAKRGVESCTNGCTNDRTYVEVNFQDGGGWRRIWYADAGHANTLTFCTASGTGFQSFTCNLNNSTGKVQVHYVFNTVTGTNNANFGWSVDDFAVKS